MCLVSQNTLVGISEACGILRVSETALRQWTDEGKIKAFVTPGGHRRYLVADLKEFMSTSHKAIGIKDLVAGIEETSSMHREIGRESLENTSLSGGWTSKSRDEMVDLGRRLLNSIIKYVSVPAERANTLKEARDVGKGLGTVLSRVGLPLTDSVAEFIKHRDPIMNATTQLLKGREARSGSVVDSISLATHVMDAALLALVAEHQRLQAEMQSKRRQETAQ